MKVIDLIIKQYNNEDMPKHIKINKLNYIYNNNRKTYESEYGEFMSFDFTNDETTRCERGIVVSTNVLNMQVELIEDEVKIIEELDKDRIENSSYSYEHHFIEKINEVIQVVNKHTEEMKSIKER